MKIDVSDEQLKNLVQEQLTAAIESGMGQYSDFRSEVRDILTKSIDSEGLAVVVQKALDRVDRDRLTQLVTETFEGMVLKSMNYLVSSAFIGVLLKLENISDYEKERVEKRTKELRSMLDV